MKWIGGIIGLVLVLVVLAGLLGSRITKPSSQTFAPQSGVSDATIARLHAQHANAYQQMLACTREDKPFRADLWETRLKKVWGETADTRGVPPPPKQSVDVRVRCENPLTQ